MRKELESAYDSGYDAGLKGPNTTNCHFSIFSTHEKTKAWKKGKAKGDAKAIKAGRKLFDRAARNRED